MLISFTRGSLIGEYRVLQKISGDCYFILLLAFNLYENKHKIRFTGIFFTSAWIYTLLKYTKTGKAINAKIKISGLKSRLSYTSNEGKIVAESFYWIYLNYQYYYAKHFIINPA